MENIIRSNYIPYVILWFQNLNFYIMTVQFHYQIIHIKIFWYKDVIDELNEDDDKQVVRILKDIKRRERLYFSIPNILMIIGLVSLLVFLTLRIKPVTKINNICTLGAFLSVISSLTLKECYKSNSLEKLAAEKKAIIRDINKSK